jgi:uncharacterized YccA/Bax inhibitor family protein
MAEEIDVNINVNTREAGQGIGDIADGVDNIGSSADMATGALDKMTGGAVSGFKSFLVGARSAIASMFTLQGAITATGIGALVVLVGSLVAYFTSTMRGAKELEIVFDVLGAVVGRITETFAALGGYIIDAVMNPKKALDDFMKGVEYLNQHVSNVVDTIQKGFIVALKTLKKWFLIAAQGAAEFFTAGLADTSAMQKEIDALSGEIQDATEDFVEAGEKMIDHVVKPFAQAAEALAAYEKELLRVAREQAQITITSQKLREAQRELSVEFAEGRAQIKEYNMVAEDMSKPLEERIDAATKAMQIEQGLMHKRQQQAAIELDLHRRQMALSESTEEDLEKEAELEVALINIRTESAELQTTLNNKLQTMRRAAAAEAQRLHEEEIARQQEIQDTYYDALDVLMDAKEREIEATYDAEDAKTQAIYDRIDEVEANEQMYQKGELDRLEKQLIEIEDYYEKLRKDIIQKYYDEEQKAANLHREYMKSDQQKELEALDAKHTKIIEAAIAAGELTKELEEKLGAERQEIIDKYAAAEVAAKKAARDEIEKGIFASLAAINQGQAKGAMDELNRQKQALLANAKTNDERNKIEQRYASKAAKIQEKEAANSRKLAIAQVLLDKGRAIASAIAAAQAAAAAAGPAAPVLSPLLTAQLVGIVLGGFASIKGIMNQAGESMPDAGAFDTGGGGGGDTGGRGNAQLALTPDVAGFLSGGGDDIVTVRSYVLQNDIADSGALANELQTQAELGG